MGVQYGAKTRGPLSSKRRSAPTLSETQQAWADYASPRPAGPPSTANPAWGVPIRGADLLDTDTVVHLGREYPIDRITAGEGGVRTAYSGVWGRTVAPDDVVRIAPRATP
jgi:hypothetical protein